MRLGCHRKALSGRFFLSVTSWSKYAAEHLNLGVGGLPLKYLDPRIPDRHPNLNRSIE